MNFNPDALLTDLMRDEGVKLMPYTDTVGKLTIGIGRNLTDRGVSRDEAIMMARNDIPIVIADLDRNAAWWRSLSPVRQCAIANMCFNMGWSRLSGFKKMLAALEQGDFVTAEKQALDSAWAKQVGMRAVRIGKMLRDG